MPAKLLHLLRLTTRTPVLDEYAFQPRPTGAHLGEALGLLVGEPVRMHSVDDDQVESASDRPGQVTLELQQLGDRHRLRQRGAP